MSKDLRYLLLKENEDLWQRAMGRLAKCKPEYEYRIRDYLDDLNQEKKALIHENKDN